jgi:septum formation protein
LAELVLASASPRRALILRGLGVRFRVVVSGADETIVPGEEAGAAAERLARVKAAAVARSEPPPILGADTVVVCAGRILGKPGSPEEARQMLRLLSGRTHEVVTGLCLVSPQGTRSGIERTAVTFAAMSPEEIDWYVAGGEPMDKAGAYHVDGKGALFVSSVTGSPSNVSGLPVRLFLSLAGEAGLDVGLPRR